MPTARGVMKQVRIKKNTTYGVLPGASGAQILRRVSCTMGLQKPGYRSQEQRADQQSSAYRHGNKNGTGQLNGELSPGTYRDLIMSALRCPTALTTTTISGIVFSVASGTPNIVARSSGSYLTDGAKIGDIVYMTGWTGAGVPLNSKLMRIVSVTALNLGLVPILNDTVASLTWPTKTAGDTVSIIFPGKKVFTPLTGHADDAYGIEEWYPDIPSSELFTDVKINTMGINVPPTGIPSIAFGLMGRDSIPATSAYFTSPTAIGTVDVFSNALGWMRLTGGSFSGDEVALTGLQLNLTNDISGEQVALSQLKPGDYHGTLVVNGQITVLYDSVDYRDAFLNELSLGLSFGMVNSPTTLTEFCAFNVPNIKFSDRTKNDVPKALTETIPFEASINALGGTGTATDQTTLVVQDGTF